MEFITDEWISLHTRKPMLITKPNNDGVLHITDPDGVKELNMSCLYKDRRNSFMRVGYVPDLSTKFPNLETINVGLQSGWAPRNIMIPRNIGAYKNLKELWIDNANIDYLPDEICELPNLVCLLAERNHITVIPDSIGMLTQLSTLYLRDNAIRVIPPMKAMRSLKYLSLEGNKIIDVFTYFNIPEHLLVHPKGREYRYRCLISCEHVSSKKQIDINRLRPNKLVMRLLARKMRIPLEHRLCRVILEKIIIRDTVT